eukprot:m.75287 g.75287  ORF g.75287 m.75287 type:complete len:738 (+) comp11842_c1_seq3:132-2345(+)
MKEPSTAQEQKRKQKGKTSKGRGNFLTPSKLAAFVAMAVIVVAILIQSPAKDSASESDEPAQSLGKATFKKNEGSDKQVPDFPTPLSTIIPPPPNSPIPFSDHPQMKFEIKEDLNKPVPGALSKIIAPFSLVNLFYQYYDKHPFHLARDNDFFAGLNSNLSNVDLLLQIHSVESGSKELQSPDTGNTQANCAFVKEGMDKLNDKYANAHEAYLDGCTIVCNIVAAYWQPMAGLMSGIEYETSMAHMANMYLTPRNSQGFVEHTDNKNGILLQTAGRKDWSLKETNFPSPTRKQMVGRPWELPSSLVAGEESLRSVVTPGDVLFIPRGVPHSARSVDDHASLHFTVSPTKNLEWVDFYMLLLAEGIPYYAAYIESIVGEGIFEQDEIFECTQEIVHASMTTLVEQSRLASEFEIRASMPWWYRALAGATVPSLLSGVDLTVDECIKEKTAKGESTEAASALKQQLAGGMTLGVVLDILNECRPLVDDINPTKAPSCEKIVDESDDDDFISNPVDVLMANQDLLKGVLPPLMSKHNVFFQYTKKLYDHGLENDFTRFQSLSFPYNGVVTFTGKEWAFAVENNTISVTSNGKSVPFRHIPQVEQQLQHMKEMEKKQGSFITADVATAVSPVDEFESMCLVRVLHNLGVVDLPSFPTEAEQQQQQPTPTDDVPVADGDSGVRVEKEKEEDVVEETGKVDNVESSNADNQEVEQTDDGDSEQTNEEDIKKMQHAVFKENLDV